ncbi:unnamed protein product [Amaranthus hypochondriacus]
MGKMGRPAKVQAVPRKPVSCSSRGSSSSPERHLFQTGNGSSGGAAASAGHPQGSMSNRVGLSWVSVLKGNPASSGLPQGGAPTTADSCSGEVTAPLVNCSVPLSPIVDARASRTIARISKSDIVDEVKYWENAVVCYVTSANPPLHVVKGFVRRTWKDLMIDKIGLVNRGVFIVRFLQKEHQERACSMNGILFDRKPFIVKPWYSDISLDKSSLTSLLIWVELPQLSLKYWSEITLTRIAGYLGKVLNIDEATRSKSRMSFARILVEMNVEEGFPEELFFSKELDEIIT